MTDRRSTSEGLLPSLTTEFKSRFMEDFEPVRFLGKGAFGRVFEVRKRRYDKKLYAVKITKTNEMQDNAREVTDETPPLGWQENQDDAMQLPIDEDCLDIEMDTSYSSFDSRQLSHHFAALYDYSSDSVPSLCNKVKETNELIAEPTLDFQTSPCTYHYIQMELCREESLAKWLETRDPELDIYKMYRKILKAVRYLHEQKLIHRDLKPGNILFGMDWTIKVRDFGLVKSTRTNGDCGTYDSRTMLSRIAQDEVMTEGVGTELYMSPEQLAKETYDHKVDVYALAIILFELLIQFETKQERVEVIKQLKLLSIPATIKDEGIMQKKLLIDMLSKDSSRRTEVKDILSKHFPKRTSTSADSGQRDTTALSSASLMKNTQRDASFKSKLLMLFLIRGIRNGYNFQLATKTPKFEMEFDDLVFKYRVDTSVEGIEHWRYRYMKARHGEEEMAKITATQLLSNNQGEFNLGKYFRSYCKLITRGEDVQDLIICTNISLHIANLKKYGIELVRLDSKDQILSFDKLSGKTPAHYKLKLGYRLRQLMYERSESYSLAQKLCKYGIRKYANMRRLLSLRIEELKNYHVALVVEKVIDLKSKTFHQDFINDENLSIGARQLRQIVSELSSGDDWKNWKFNLANNFGKCKPKVNYDALPRTVFDAEIDGFFDKLVFVVDTPNDSELDEILTSEVGQRYKMLDSDIQSDFILRKINLALRSGGSFLTTEDGKKILKDAGQKLDTIKLRTLSIDYQKGLRKIHSNKNNRDIIGELQSFLNSGEVLRVITPWPEGTAAKIFSALDTIADYKYQDSYLVLPSKRIRTQSEMASVKKMIESGKFQLLVIVCVDALFQEMYKKLEPSLTSDVKCNKKLIVIDDGDEEDTNRTQVPIWREIQDQPWSPDKIECIQMNLRENSKERNILSKMLSRHRNSIIGVVFLQGLRDVSYLRRTMSANYKIVYNQTDRTSGDKNKSESFAMILAHRSFKPSRIFPPQVTCNPKFMAGVRLSCNGISLYSIDLGQNVADNFKTFLSPLRKVDTCKMVVCTSSVFDRDKEVIRNCGLQLGNTTPEGDNLTLYGASVNISSWQHIEQDGNYYIRFSIY